MLKLKLENINKTFDGKNFVVKNFNLEVNNEDFVVLSWPIWVRETYRKNKRPFHPSPTALDRS